MWKRSRLHIFFSPKEQGSQPLSFAKILSVFEINQLGQAVNGDFQPGRPRPGARERF
jgi:hypothetical protein